MNMTLAQKQAMQTFLQAGHFIFEVAYNPTTTTDSPNPETEAIDNGYILYIDPVTSASMRQVSAELIENLYYLVAPDGTNVGNSQFNGFPPSAPPQLPTTPDGSTGPAAIGSPNYQGLPPSYPPQLPTTPDGSTGPAAIGSPNYQGLPPSYPPQLPVATDGSSGPASIGTDTYTGFPQSYPASIPGTGTDNSP
jgi:hypothetical protein